MTIAGGLCPVLKICAVRGRDSWKIRHIQPTEKPLLDRDKEGQAASPTRLKGGGSEGRAGQAAGALRVGQGAPATGTATSLGGQQAPHSVVALPYPSTV